MSKLKGINIELGLDDKFKSKLKAISTHVDGLVKELNQIDSGEAKEENLLIANNTKNKTVTVTGLKQNMTYVEFAELKSLIDSVMDTIPKEDTHIYIKDLKYWMPRY